MTTSRAARSMLTAALVAALALAGCSSDDSGEGADEGADRDETTTTTEPPPTTEPPTTSTTTPLVDTTTVEIEGYAFGPEAIRVAVGDTVTWTNLDDFAHTTTSDTDLWDSGPLDPQVPFSHTFTEAGTYPYLCNIHNYMTGQVVVE